MSAEDKAIELVKKFKGETDHALICVEEIITTCKSVENYTANHSGFSQIPFWQKVKNELRKF